MEQICTDLEAEQSALDAVVSDLSEERWRAATPADGWSITDTIVHLVTADVAARLAADNADEFAVAKAAILAGGLDAFFGIEDGRSGAEVLAWWRDERSHMVAAFRRCQPKDRIPWFGPDMSALSFGTARLMETWSHGQDIADTVGVTLPPTDRIRHVAHLGVSTRRWSYLNRGLEPPDVPIYVELTAPSGKVWRWGSDAASDRVSGPAEAFCLVVTQRRHRAATALVVEGRHAVEWIDLAQAFAGPPTTTSPARSGP